VLSRSLSSGVTEAVSSPLQFLRAVMGLLKSPMTLTLTLSATRSWIELCTTSALMGGLVKPSLPLSKSSSV